jgi:hypothetical protein
MAEGLAEVGVGRRESRDPGVGQVELVAAGAEAVPAELAIPVPVDVGPRRTSRTPRISPMVRQGC